LTFVNRTNNSFPIIYQEQVMDDYLGAIRMWAGDFEPLNFLFCRGQELPVQQYQNLYNLIGNAFGGTPGRTFKLPDMQARIPVGMKENESYPLGKSGGTTQETITIETMPAHTHQISAFIKEACEAGVGTNSSPQNNYPASVSGKGVNLYNSFAGSYMGDIESNFSEATVGANQPHNNVPPYQVINFIICYNGFSPSRP
jgi:microcystin-dependent protein